MRLHLITSALLLAQVAYGARQLESNQDFRSLLNSRSASSSENEDAGAVGDFSQKFGKFGMKFGGGLKFGGKFGKFGGGVKFGGFKFGGSKFGKYGGGKYGKYGGGKAHKYGGGKYGGGKYGGGKYGGGKAHKYGGHGRPYYPPANPGYHGAPHANPNPGYHGAYPGAQVGARAPTCNTLCGAQQFRGVPFNRGIREIAPHACGKCTWQTAGVTSCGSREKLIKVGIRKLCCRIYEHHPKCTQGTHQPSLQPSTGVYPGAGQPVHPGQPGYSSQPSPSGQPAYPGQAGPHVQPAAPGYMGA